MAIITPLRHTALWMGMAYLNEDIQSTYPMLKLLPNREFVVPALSDDDAGAANAAIQKLFTDPQRFQAFVCGDTDERKEIEASDHDLKFASVALDVFFEWLASSQFGRNLREDVEFGPPRR